MRGSDSGYAHGTSGSPQSTLEESEYAAAVAENESRLAREFGGAMPNRSQAVTPIEKFSKYSLDPTNPKAAGKAEAYRRGLGYTQTNASELRDKIHAAVTSESSTPYEVQVSQYGTKFKYRIRITGPNGNTRNVIAVYQIDKGAVVPRMITNYLERKKK